MWEEYLKETSNEDIKDWQTALKAFITEGKKLGVPLSIIKQLQQIEE